MNIDYARQLLRLDERCTPDEIKQAYMQAVAATQSNSGEENENGKKLSLLNEAYDFLMKEKKIRDQIVQGSSLKQGEMPHTANADLALVRNDAGFHPCPTCGEMVPGASTNCPQCGTQIARYCPACGQIVQRNEQICSRCGIVLEDYEKKNFLKALATEMRVQNEREAVAMNSALIEQENERFIVRGIGIWALIILGFFVILAVAVYIFYLFF